MDFHRQQCTPGLSRPEPQWSRTEAPACRDRAPTRSDSPWDAQQII